MERGIRIFISYAMKDSKRLKISKIATLLEDGKNIDKVHFWEGWNGFPNGNIIEFMEKGITECDVFIPVFTEASIKSDNCRKERDMALFQNKRVIPLFESFSLVPPACQPYLGVNLAGKNVNDVIFELNKLISPHERTKEKNLLKEKEKKEKIEEENLKKGKKFRVGREVIPIGEFGNYKIILTIENIGNISLKNFILMDEIPDEFEHGRFSGDLPEIINENGIDTLNWEIEELKEKEKLEISYEIYGKGEYRPRDAKLIL